MYYQQLCISKKAAKRQASGTLATAVVDSSKQQKYKHNISGNEPNNDNTANLYTYTYISTFVAVLPCRGVKGLLITLLKTTTQSECVRR